uniref:hypothetical protein n=1 Tax=uncultured Psychrobacter sp. TaxID=259303 RepID=UPI0026307CE3|nr:hypothetical protein [uncultured Psychrobacter sp.]
MNFKFIGTPKYINDKEVFIYQDVNLMEYQYQWESVTDKFPRLEFIIDAGGTVFKPAVYKLEINNKNLVFASGEISNGIWGFALPEE